MPLTQARSSKTYGEHWERDPRQTSSTPQTPQVNPFFFFYISPTLDSTSFPTQGWGSTYPPSTVCSTYIYTYKPCPILHSQRSSSTPSREALDRLIRGSAGLSKWDKPFGSWTRALPLGSSLVNTVFLSNNNLTSMPVSPASPNCSKVSSGGYIGAVRLC